LTDALGSNYPEIPDSCRSLEFPLLIDVSEVFVDGAQVLLEQLGDLGLGEPKSLILEAALDARAAVLGLVQQDFAVGEGLRWTGIGFLAHLGPPGSRGGLNLLHIEAVCKRNGEGGIFGARGSLGIPWSQRGL